MDLVSSSSSVAVINAIKVNDFCSHIFHVFSTSVLYKIPQLYCYDDPLLRDLFVFKSDCDTTIINFKTFTAELFLTS